MAKLILYSGKGGVGKSTTSAASAYHWAGQGYKTLLVSTDPAHSTEDVLGTPVGSSATPIATNLWAMNIDSCAKARGFQEQFQNNMDNTVAKWFPGFDPEILSDWASFPGMDEVFALEELMHLVEGIEYDLIVYDTAPTGHTLKALTAPDAMNKFLLRILRMKSRIENIKSIFLKKNDTDKLVALLEETITKIDKFKALLRNEDFVSINLVGIPTEAGYQECIKTIKYLQDQGFVIHNLVINNIIPTFDEPTWEAAASNKAVALLKMERENQQPYITKFNTVTNRENIKLTGVSKLPFQPMGDRLPEFAKFLWKDGGMVFEPEHSVKQENGDDLVRLRLRFPHSGKVVLNDRSYKIDYNEYPIPLPLDLLVATPRKQKTSQGATYTYKV